MYSKAFLGFIIVTCQISQFIFINKWKLLWTSLRKEGFAFSQLQFTAKCFSLYCFFVFHTGIMLVVSITLVFKVCTFVYFEFLQSQSSHWSSVWRLDSLEAEAVLFLSSENQEVKVSAKLAFQSSISLFKEILTCKSKLILYVLS